MTLFSRYGLGSGYNGAYFVPALSRLSTSVVAESSESPKDIYEGLFPTVLSSIERPEVGAHNPEINDLRCIGSYNWVDNINPTIIAPGSPPIWRQKSMPFQVIHDQLNSRINQDGHRLPSCDLLPLFKAVDVAKEDEPSLDIDWKSVDFVTNRNGLRKLLRWIDGRGDSKRQRPFRLDLELAGKRTVLLNRWEENRLAPPGMGYGFGFEKEATVPAPGCENSTGHHRIVQYDFGGLNMVVRFEVDACIEMLPQATPQGRSINNNMTRKLNDLASSLHSTSGVDVEVIRAGQLVPQNSIVELTTRSERGANYFDWTESYPQLWLSQTPHHFLAVHYKGLFHRLEIRTLDDDEMKYVHAEFEGTFKKLRALLETIQEIVVKHGKGSCLSLVCKDGILAVHEREGRDGCLPDEVMNRFH